MTNSKPPHPKYALGDTVWYHRYVTDSFKVHPGIVRRMQFIPAGPDHDALWRYTLRADNASAVFLSEQELFATKDEAVADRKRILDGYIDNQRQCVYKLHEDLEREEKHYEKLLRLQCETL